MDKISVTIKVDKPNYLRNCIAPNKKHLIQELIIDGTIHKDIDFEFIRSMCNSLDEDGKRTGGQLEVLDLAKAKFWYSYGPYTALYDDMLKGCITLKRVNIGEIESIYPHCFSGCTSLEQIVCDYNEYACYSDALFKVRQPLYKENKRVYDYFPNEEKILVKVPASIKSTKAFRHFNIEKICDYAFEDFRGSDIYMPAVPPLCSKKAFDDDAYTKVIIHVPKGSFNSYWSHAVWGDFQIVEDD